MNQGCERGESDWTIKCLSAFIHHIGQDIELTAPVLLVVVVRRQHLSARDLPQSPREAVDDGVAQDPSNQAVRDRVGEGHEHERHEGGDAVAGVVPVDRQDTTHHHAAHEDERAAGGPGRNGGEYGSEEEGDEEEKAGRDGGDTCATTFLDTSLAIE